MTVFKKIGPALLVGVAALAGCSKDSESSYPQPAASQGDEASPQETTSTDQSSSTQLSDSQILGIMATVDAGEIEQARLALQTASDARVKQFATHMIEQHTDSTQKISSVAAQHGLTPAASSTSTKLKQKSEKMLSSLNNTAAATFDGTYMNGQIQQHQQVLDMLDSQLIPASRSDAVSTQLKAAHTMVQAHLNEARQLEPQLDTAAKTDVTQPPHTMPLPQP
jgi:predicted outer membrane protein